MMREFALSVLLLHTKTIMKPNPEKLSSSMYYIWCINKKKPLLKVSEGQPFVLEQNFNSWARCWGVGTPLWFTIKTIQVVDLAGVTLSTTANTLESTNLY